MVQIFESTGMMINDDYYGNVEEVNMIKYCCIPCLGDIAVEIKKRHPGLPLMIFYRGS